MNRSLTTEVSVQPTKQLCAKNLGVVVVGHSLIYFPLLQQYVMFSV